MRARIMDFIDDNLGIFVVAWFLVIALIAKDILTIDDQLGGGDDDF